MESQVLNAAKSEQESPGSLRFLGLVLLAGILSVLSHELGHCIFYWLQGIPATMSLVKEYPLRDITAREYGIGSAGGPLANVLQVVVAYGLHQKYRANTRLRRFLAALVLANVFYFLLAGLLTLLKGNGDELEDAARLFGLNHLFVVGLFFVLTAVVAYLWVTRNGVAISFKNSGIFLGLFVVYLIVLSAMHTMDRALFWHHFPTVRIDDGRVYNQHFR